MSAGTLRIVGTPTTPGDPLLPYECRVEACVDGVWTPLRGICSIEIHVADDQIVTAHLVIEPTELVITEAMVGKMQLARHAGWWRRLLYKLRGLT